MHENGDIRVEYTMEKVTGAVVSSQARIVRVSSVGAKDVMGPGIMGIDREVAEELGNIGDEISDDEASADKEVENAGVPTKGPVDIDVRRETPVEESCEEILVVEQAVSTTAQGEEPVIEERTKKGQALDGEQIQEARIGTGIHEGELDVNKVQEIGEVSSGDEIPPSRTSNRCSVMIQWCKRSPKVQKKKKQAKASSPPPRKGPLIKYPSPREDIKEETEEPDLLDRDEAKAARKRKGKQVESSKLKIVKKVSQMEEIQDPIDVPYGPVAKKLAPATKEGSTDEETKTDEVGVEHSWKLYVSIDNSLLSVMNTFKDKKMMKAYLSRVFNAK